MAKTIQLLEIHTTINEDRSAFKVEMLVRKNDEGVVTQYWDSDTVPVSDIDTYSPYDTPLTGLSGFDVYPT